MWRLLPVVFGMAVLCPASDRVAAEWVLRSGGAVVVEGAGAEIRNIDELPPRTSLRCEPCGRAARRRTSLTETLEN
jgi:hypothetical protein